MKMTDLLVILTYSVVGFLEWLIATLRTISIMRDWILLIPPLVFLENLVALGVYERFTTQHDWMIAITYSIGCAFGSLLPVYLLRKKHEHGCADK